MKPIAILSTPWPLFNRPSIQLGSLKAFIETTVPETPVESHHLYLDIAEALGYNLYGEISEKTWLAESLYAALLQPERTEAIGKFWRRRSAGAPLAKKQDFVALSLKLLEISNHILDSTDWGRYPLVGFSICFGQLTSSLYFIQEIKERAPSVRIVVGGSSCAGELGESLLNAFPKIDFVIQGEGERPLGHLVNSLANSPDTILLEPYPGLIGRDLHGGEESVSQIPRLDDLPIPDYGEYFSRLRSYGQERKFLPKIPMEISRGCWWRKHESKAGAKGCAFCNLNLQWKGYRSKSHDRTVTELETLADRYGLLSVSFMDNLLPAAHSKRLFRRIGSLQKDFRLFGELRADTSREILAVMGAAGMREVQVGIESLSSSLLRKLNKGTSAIDNLEIMKNCEINGLPDLTGNLILNFPLSDEEDVAETLRNMDFALPFRPLKGVPFWLGYGSPVYQFPWAYRVRRVQNHPFHKNLFPPEAFPHLHLMIQGYRGGVRHQRRLWKPVKEKLEVWRKSYLKLHSSGPGLSTPSQCDPILSYLDGGSFMIIRERRHKAHDMTHRLKATSRRIYLFCESQRTLSRILSEFPSFGGEQIRGFLRMMTEKRLMFNEGDRYLSLAVPARGVRTVQRSGLIPSDKEPKSPPWG